MAYSTSPIRCPSQVSHRRHLTLSCLRLMCTTHVYYVGNPCIGEWAGRGFKNRVQRNTRRGVNKNWINVFIFSLVSNSGKDQGEWAPHYLAVFVHSDLENYECMYLLYCSREWRVSGLGRVWGSQVHAHTSSWVYTMATLNHGGTNHGYQQNSKLYTCQTTITLII